MKILLLSILICLLTLFGLFFAPVYVFGFEVVFPGLFGKILLFWYFIIGTSWFSLGFYFDEDIVNENN